MNALPSISAPSRKEALTLEALRALDGAPLVAFLRERRWFGAKAGVPRTARIVDVVPLPWSDGAFVVTAFHVIAAPAPAMPVLLVSLIGTLNVCLLSSLLTMPFTAPPDRGKNPATLPAVPLKT